MASKKLDLAEWAKGVIPPGLEVDHPLTVRRLALDIFDHTRDLHDLGKGSRRVLELASLLHDLGLAKGERAHNRESYRMILEMDLPCKAKRAPLVAAVARYHRKAPPSEGDREVRLLRPKDRRRLAWLAGILRLADGLDADRRGADRKVRVVPLKDRVVMEVRRPVSPPVMMAIERKKDLFVSVSRRALVVRWI